MCYRGRGLGWRELQERARRERARWVAEAALYVAADPWRMVGAGVLVIGLVASLALWWPGCADAPPAPPRIEAAESLQMACSGLPKGLGCPPEVAR